MKHFFSAFWMVFVLYACQEKETPKSTSVSSTPPPKTAFSPVFQQKNTEESGVFFINELSEDPYRNILLYQYFYNGGGVAAGDVNRDGKTDLFFTGNMVANKLYLNQGGFKFQDATLPAGIVNPSTNSWCTGVNMADVNADGWLDIYVCRSGNLQEENRENLLYINQKDGTFKEQAKDFGLNDPSYSIQSAFFDYDHDGDLDMFLLNHGMEYYSGMIAANEGGRDPFIGDKLYRNDNGYFRDVSATAGIEGNKYGYGLGLAVADLNQDGWDDVYVANDFFEHDYLYLNNGDGTFTESIHESTGHISFFGMGVDLADYNNDALADIVVVDMSAEDHVRQKTNLAGISKNKFWDFVDKGYHYQYMFNSLQLNRGVSPDGQLAFSNVAQLAGMDQTDWSWSPLMADLDNDGWKDLYITNGLRKDVLNNDFIQNLNEELHALNTDFVDLPPAQALQILSKMPTEKVANYAYQNNGDLTFSNVSREWQLDMPGFSNGAVYADLDNDGDLDLVVNNLDDFAAVYENQLPRKKHHFLRISLQGSAANPLAYGAKVYLYQQGQVQYQQLHPSRGYQSSMEPVIHFGLGKNPKVDSIRIAWPDGKVSRIPQPGADKLLTFSIIDAKEIKTDDLKQETWLYEISVNGLGVPHHENEFDDFNREFLLPHKLSIEGPALALGDVNGDGLDDVYLGGAKGHPSQLMIQQQNLSFQPLPGPWTQDAAHEDVDAVFFDADADGDLDLYVVSGSAEFEVDSPILQDRLYLNEEGKFTKADHALPLMTTHGLCVKAHDYDADGDVDLFVGGGNIPGKYPLADRSYLLENRSGRFVDVTEEKSPSLRNIGIVRDALWRSSLENQQAGLLVVGEWMQPTFFSWQNGKLQPDQKVEFVNAANQPIALQGWWQSAHTFDVDQDGDQDYLLGNIGLNYRYEASTANPLELFVHDMDQNGSLELFLGHHQQGQLVPVQERHELFQQWTGIKKLYPDHASYAVATIPEIMDDAYQQALHLQADTLAHVILYNEGGGKYTVRALPVEGQISPLRDAVFADISGDEKEELITAGNFYETNIEVPRLDASYGQVYKLENGQLDPIGMKKSGFYAEGDIRKLAVLKTARGKLILVAGNNQPLRVYSTKILSSSDKIASSMISKK